MSDLYHRSKKYAEDQLKKRDEKKMNGEKTGGIKSLIARAWFHGYIARDKDNKNEKPEVKDEV